MTVWDLSDLCLLTDGGCLCDCVGSESSVPPYCEDSFTLGRARWAILMLGVNCLCLLAGRRENMTFGGAGQWVRGHG